MTPLPYLAFDTETEVIEGPRDRVPRMATLQVSNGRRHVVLRPDQTEDFLLPLLLDRNGPPFLVGWNISFDWAVVLEVLKRPDLRRAWWSMMADGRFRDAMLLDFLVRLSDPSGAAFDLRNLGQAAKSHGMHADKDFEGRLRFGELLDKSPEEWAATPQEWFDYAVTDVVVTHALYGRLHEQALAKDPRHGVPHGPLTEGLQLRAAVALDICGRNGFAVNQEAAHAARTRLKSDIDALVERLDALAPGAFKRYKIKSRAGELMVHSTTGVPSLNLPVMRGALEAMCRAEGIDPDSLPRTEKSRELTTALDPWKEAAGHTDLVATWAELQAKCKLHQFLCQIDGRDSLHASYQPLKRTGRTSCRQPNIQNMPREAWLRGLFVPRPGHKLAIVDYSAIELVTLAAVCLDRYGESVLAEQITAGRDPHAYTAALVQEVDYFDFLKWKTDPARKEEFKTLRQAAKAVNFGVPGGLGAVKLAAYARANYGVTLTPDQAKTLREKLVTGVYPELSKYLADEPADRLAANLNRPRHAVDACFAHHLGRPPFPGFYTLLDKVVAGNNFKANGDRIADSLRTAMWDGLEELTRGTPLHAQVIRFRGNQHLWRALMGGTAVTLTGRVRAGLSYTECRNTPFQGLAADGAKVALWRLTEDGYRVVAFVHDEIVCEVPAASAARDLADIERVMIESMSSVLGCGIPVKVEGKVSDRWEK
jgi:hypothetical protein